MVTAKARLQTNPDLVPSAISEREFFLFADPGTVFEMPLELLPWLEGFAEPRRVEEVVPEATEDDLEHIRSWIEHEVLVAVEEGVSLPPSPEAQRYRRCLEALGPMRPRHEAEENSIPVDIRQQMSELLQTTLLVQAVSVAAKLGIADRVKDGPKTVAELAEEIGARENSLRRLLKALSTKDIFAIDEVGQVSSTPMAMSLVSGIPGSVRASSMLGGEPTFADALSRLRFSVMTGRSSFEELHGKNLFEFLANEPELRQLFQSTMTEQTEWVVASLVVGAYDFSGFETVVDVGGGRGTLLASIVATYPSMRGILFDRGEVVQGAEEVFESLGVADRCDVAQGDFFSSPLPRGDAYILKRIVHDWDDERALRILCRCREVMKERDKLLIVELVTDEETRAWADLEMLFLTGGRERSEAEFSELLQRAGLRLERIVAAGNVDILEAVPV